MAQAPKTTKIKLTGRETRRVGVNGKFFTVPAGQEVEVEQEVLDVLRGSGVAFSEVNSDGAASQEGSGEVAPATTPPAMIPQSLDSNYAAGTGTQPGNVTEGGGGTDASQTQETIAERAAISDIRVAAERRTTGDESPAELAGEGEAGTPAAHPLDHDENGKKGGSKPRAKK